MAYQRTHYTPLRRVRNGAVLLAIALAVGVLGYRWLCGKGWLESLWFVVITVTTVGYGERSDSTATVQLFTIFLITFGMSALVYTSTGFFQLLLEGELQRSLGYRRMTRQIEKLSGHTIICGLGRSGRILSEALIRRGREVVIIDNNEERLEEAVEMACLVLDGDATQETTLQEAGIERAASLVTALPSDADNVFITLTARELNPDVFIVARASQEHTGKKLRQAGAQKVVMPASVTAKIMSRMILDPSVADWLALIGESTYEELDIEELTVNKYPALVGKTIRESDAQRRHGLLVVALRNAEGDIVANPGADYTLQANDVIVVMGDPRRIHQFRADHHS